MYLKFHQSRLEMTQLIQQDRIVIKIHQMCCVSQRQTLVLNTFAQNESVEIPTPHDWIVSVLYTVSEGPVIGLGHKQ